MMTEAVLMACTYTTRTQLAGSLALVAEHPDQWARLVAEPELAPRAVEETMRLLGTVRGTARVASEDIDLHDITFPAGTLVMTSLAAANHDPDIWDDPHRFHITRPPSTSPQLPLDTGIPFCLGARSEGRRGGKGCGSK